MLDLKNVKVIVITDKQHELGIDEYVLEVEPLTIRKRLSMFYLMTEEHYRTKGPVIKQYQ